MTILQAIFLGVIQGLTEFLPVSSSGHLALAQHIMGLPEVPISFDVLLHLATLIAVVIVLFNPLKEIATNTLPHVVSGKFNQITPLFWLLAIGSIPAALFGILLNDYMDSIFNSVKYFSIGFLITSILLTIASRMKPGTKKVSQMKWQESLKIGIFQAVAILPSISRSGATISGALFHGFKAGDAFTFSFLLSIPAILGAGALHAKELLSIQSYQLPSYSFGFVAALSSGWISLLVFRRILIERKLSLFAYYCLFLSLFIFFFIK